MLSVKQGSIKYYFLSLWYDSIWDWTPASRAIGQHSNYYGNYQNAEKNPGDLRKLAVSQTPVENIQLTLVWKIFIGVK